MQGLRKVAIAERLVGLGLGEHPSEPGRVVPPWWPPPGQDGPVGCSPVRGGGLCALGVGQQAAGDTPIHRAFCVFNVLSVCLMFIDNKS